MKSSFIRRERSLLSVPQRRVDILAAAISSSSLFEIDVPWTRVQWDVTCLYALCIDVVILEADHAKNPAPGVINLIFASFLLLAER